MLRNARTRADAKLKVGLNLYYKYPQILVVLPGFIMAVLVDLASIVILINWFDTP